MPGLNQPTAQHPPTEVGGITGAHLLQYIERIERLETEKAEISENSKEVFQEAKSCGFDPKIMRIVLRDRKRTQDELDEEETMVHLYKRAIDVTPTTS